MKIEKAIEELEIMKRVQTTGGFEERREAIKLGIEALKRLKYHRSLHSFPFYKLLPGETK